MPSVARYGTGRENFITRGLEIFDISILEK